MLLNLKPAVSATPLTDSDIPASIARDTEVSAAIASHTNATDPHPIYLTQPEGDSRYRQTGVALADSDIPASIARDTEVTAAITSHTAAVDPHPIYLTQAEGDARYLNTGGGSGIAATVAISEIENALRQRFKSNIFAETHYLSSAGDGSFPNSASNGGFTYPRAEIDRPGILGMSTGSNAAGFVSAATGMGNNSSPLLLDDGDIRYFAIVKIPVLRDATNDFIIEVGFQSAGTSIGLDAVCFIYDSASPNWQCHTRTNGDLAVFISGVTVTANQWFEMSISVIDGSAIFTINNINVLTTSQKLPLGTRMVGAGIDIRKIGGTTGRDILVDYQSVEQIFNDSQNGGTIAVLSRQLTDADIPAVIARDTEVTAVIASHTAAVDPHPQYLRFKKIEFTTGSTQGAITTTTHGLTQSRIAGFSAMIKIDLSNSAGFAPLVSPGGLVGIPGYNYSVNLDLNNIFCRLVAGDSANIMNRPIIVTIFYSS
ncbi:hypothetical protein, partial [Microcoleus sp.]|uniref:hypothetical protein n=1 Tax=Microcoleus sp. TaxID=44472 RepID=UPI0035931DB5